MSLIDFMVILLLYVNLRKIEFTEINQLLVTTDNLFTLSPIIFEKQLMRESNGIVQIGMITKRKLGMGTPFRLGNTYKGVITNSANNEACSYYLENDSGWFWPGTV